jgi:methyl-accepting chemotaxis protein
MNSLSLKNKLIMLVAVLIFFNLSIGIIGIYSSQKVAKDYSEIETVNLPDTTSMLEALADFRSARIYLEKLGYPNLPESLIKDMRARIPTQWEKFDAEIKHYMGTNVMQSDEIALVKPFTENTELLKKTFARALELQEKSNGKEGPSMDEFRKLINVDLLKQGADFRTAVMGLVNFQKEDAKKNADTAHATRDTAKKYIIASLIASTALGILMFLFILKNILKDQGITEAALSESGKKSNMIEKSPVNIMTASPDGILSYMNNNSIETLRTLQKFLPEKVDTMVGKSIDVFHKNPQIIKKIIQDPRNLPHSAVITVGPEKLDLLVTAILDNENKYLGPMVVWSVITDRVNLINDLVKASSELSEASHTVLGISSNLSAAAEETSAQANTASVASEEVSAGVQNVTTNMSEMTAAIKEITKTTNEAAAMTKEAMELSKSANQIINQLGDSSLEIGNVIKVISSIAQQTNLLALNATIEAARAGEAGKGFAVVANEVKELANQTAKATGDITKRIEAIQADSKNAVNAIANITAAIEKVNGHTDNIAAAVEEQAATTNEVTRIVSESTEGVHQITENIGQVSVAAANTGKDASSVLKASRSIEVIAATLEQCVHNLKSGGAMDFDASVKAHQDWKGKLANYLKKPDGSLKAADVCLDNKCQLGKWIYSGGVRWESLSEYSTLKTEHAKFHKCAGEIITKADTGLKINAEELLGNNSEFGKISSTVIEAIMKIKAKV